MLRYHQTGEIGQPSQKEFFELLCMCKSLLLADPGSTRGYLAAVLQGWGEMQTRCQKKGSLEGTDGVSIPFGPQTRPTVCWALSGKGERGRCASQWRVQWENTLGHLRWKRAGTFLFPSQPARFVLCLSLRSGPQSCHPGGFFRDSPA